MSPVGFIGQTSHSRIMSHAHNGPQVPADAIVGRIIYQYSDGIGMFRNSPCHLLALHAQRNPQPRIDFRIDINRNGTAEYQGIDDTFMDVAWQDNLIPPFADGQYHALHGTGRTADHEERMIGAKCFGCQFFRLADDRNRMAEIIQRLHAVDIDADALFSQKRRQFRISPSPLMTRYIKRDNAHITEALQCFINRCPLL